MPLWYFKKNFLPTILSLLKPSPLGHQFVRWTNEKLNAWWSELRQEKMNKTTFYWEKLFLHSQSTWDQKRVSLSSYDRYTRKCLIILLYGTYFGLLAGVIWIVLQNYSLNYAATSNMIHIIHSLPVAHYYEWDDVC